jgi:hypothetical protein
METELFVKAMDRHLTDGRWYPTPTEIRGHYWAAKASSNATTLAKLSMPNNIPADQEEINRQGLQGIRAVFAARRARLEACN